MRENISFLATAIGSLPHTSTNAAIDLIYDTIGDAPLCPQLSKVNSNEDMLIQYTENFPGIMIEEKTKKRYADLNSDEYFTALEELFTDFEEITSSENLDSDTLQKYAITKDYASAFELFINRLKEKQPNFVKGQIIGPFTFGTSTLDTDKKCTFYDETYREVITQTLTLKALWQVNEFKKAAKNAQPIIFIDEPTMSQLGTSAYITVSKEDIQEVINQIAEVLHKYNVIVGMHCCGKADWETVLNSQLDLINFDAFFFAQNFSLFSTSLDKFLDRGGLIAWGVVPTLDTDALENTTIEELTQIYENAKNLLVAKGIDEKKILNASILTPSCGAGSLSEENAKRAMTYLKELSKNLKNKYSMVTK